jgi:hypothetical protein
LKTITITAISWWIYLIAVPILPQPDKNGNGRKVSEKCDCPHFRELVSTPVKVK